MIHRIALMGAGLATAAALTACTAPDPVTEESSPAAAESAEPTEEERTPGVMTTPVSYTHLTLPTKA